MLSGVDIFCSEELQKRISELEDQLRMKESEKPDETSLVEQKYKEVRPIYFYLLLISCRVFATLSLSKKRPADPPLLFLASCLMAKKDIPNH